MKPGIILIAGGYPLYGTCALNLAISIKAYDQTVPIILVHDEQSIEHLTEKELGVFDILKTADPADYVIGETKQYQRLKLCVDKYSDFDYTLYIDVDTIWFPRKKISDLIDKLKAYEFFIGQNGHYDPNTGIKSTQTYTFWEEPKTICDYFGIKNKLPQTVSGVFWFKKGEFSDRVFNRGREIYDDPNVPCKPWANGKPDEYCFNVALAEGGHNQQDSHIVFFDRINGALNSKQIYSSFWGLAIGGTKISDHMRGIYDGLVKLYAKVFEIEPRYCQNKSGLVGRI